MLFSLLPLLLIIRNFIVEIVIQRQGCVYSIEVIYDITFLVSYDFELVNVRAKCEPTLIRLINSKFKQGFS